MTNERGQRRYVEEPVGDPLGRFYTPDPVAELVVRDVLVPMLQAHNVSRPKILEMSVGGGSFVFWIRQYIEGAYVHGNDLDPDAPGLKLCDRTSNVDAARTRWSEGWDVNIGNPPWDPPAPAAPTIDHVGRAIRTAPIGLLVLPWSYGGQPTWSPMFSLEVGFEGVQPINPRPWIAHREAALYRWNAHIERRERREYFQPLVWR